MGINEYIKIGSRIKELRKSKGMSQRDMANKLNLSFSTYSNYENNYREPKFELIEEIAEILGVTIQCLIGGESSERIEKEYDLRKGAFIDYLYSLGFSVETPIDLSNDPIHHYIGYNDGECKVVEANKFNSLQKESDKYITYLVNRLLDDSIDISNYLDKYNETEHNE